MLSSRVWRRLVATLTVLLAVGSVQAVIVPATALAGRWIQVACENPSGSPASNEGFSSLAAGGGYGSTTGVRCSPGNPMFALLSSAVPVGVGSSETIAYQPPGGSALDGGTVDVTMSASGYGVDASAVAVAYSPAFSYDASDVFFQCAELDEGMGGACNNGTSSYSGLLSLPTGAGGNFYLSAGCGGVGGQECDAGGSNGAWSEVQLWWAQMLLSNNSTPTGSGFGGSLLGSSASGTATLAFTAADPGGPGVYKVSVLIDGQAVYSATPNANAGACAAVGSEPASGALMFDSAQPCPQSESLDIPISTVALADGHHELKVEVTDAAGNTSTVLDQTITTANRTTVSALLRSAPAATTTTTTPATTTPATTTPTTTPATTTTPTPTTTPASSSAPATTPSLYAFSLSPATKRMSKGLHRGYSRSALALSGTLENEAGVPATDVPVSLWSKPRSGGVFTEIAHSTSTATGGWSLKVPKGASRVLRVIAGAGAQPASSPSAVSVSETVTPSLSLHIATPGGARLIFTGHLGIAPIGKPRPTVLIEVWGQHGWQAVGAPVRVSAHGNYRYLYRSSPFTVGRRFRFRALTPAATLWSTASSRSRKAKVH